LKIEKKRRNASKNGIKIRPVFTRITVGFYVISL
jgi:hypothetical protein